MPSKSSRYNDMVGWHHGRKLKRGGWEEPVPRRHKPDFWKRAYQAVKPKEKR